MNHVCIIGGGISGLSAAWYLQNLAPWCNYTLIEASDRLGGKITTEHVNGFVIEGGPESMLVQKSAALNFCSELGLGSHVIPFESSKLYILHGGKLIPLPGGFKLIVPTNKKALMNSPLFSEQGKQRILAEEQVPPRMDDRDESLANFIRRRFGDECLQRLGGPLMGGIYVADPEKLSIKSTFPQLRRLEKEYGSLIRAMKNYEQITDDSSPAVLAQDPSSKDAGIPDRRRPIKKTAIFFSLRNGLGEMVEALHQKLTGNILTGRSVQKIVRVGKNFNIIFDGGHIECCALICTVPANHAASITASLDTDLAMELSHIRFSSSAAISLGYRKSEFESETDFDGSGFIFSTSDRQKILSCGVTSNKSVYRAPKDMTLLRLFVGDEVGKIPNQSDKTLVEIARQELKGRLGIHCKPILNRVFRWHNANPQFDVGHADHVQTIKTLTSKIPGLFLAGCSYHGVGIPDCITNAKNAVAQLIAN